MKSNLNVQLYKNRKVVWLVSFSLSLISIIGMFLCYRSSTINAPLKLGLDYTGGTQITLERQCNNICIELNTSDISNNIIDFVSASFAALGSFTIISRPFI